MESGLIESSGMLRNSSEVINPCTRITSKSGNGFHLNSRRKARGNGNTRKYLSSTIQRSKSFVQRSYFLLRDFAMSQKIFGVLADERTIISMPERTTKLLTAIITQSDQFIDLKLVEPVGDRLSHDTPTYVCAGQPPPSFRLSSYQLAYVQVWLKCDTFSECLWGFRLHHPSFLLRGAFKLRT